MRLRTVLTTKKLFLVYVLGTFVAVTIIIFNLGYWCTSSTDVKMPHDQVYEDSSLIQQSKSLLVLQEHLRQWEINLMATERELKRLHPEHTDAILRKYMSPDLPVIYIITPTYARPVQKAELTRLSHTFMLVKNIHWIVIEDAEKPSDLVRNFLKLSRLKYTHLSTATPSSYKMSSSDPSWRKPRGVLQRNEGIAWLHKNLNQFRDSGVVYFADDDNTYDLQLFEEMRYTQRASVWPVGLVGYLRYESPILDENGRVAGWFTYWKPERPFALDMAGFAVNLKLVLQNPIVKFNLNTSRGEQESYFLDQLVKLSDLEPKANNCTKILVWHTRTEQANLKNEDKLVAKGLHGSDMAIEV